MNKVFLGWKPIGCKSLDFIANLFMKCVCLVGETFHFLWIFFALIEEELKGIKFRGQRTVSRRTRGPVF